MQSADTKGSPGSVCLMGKVQLGHMCWRRATWTPRGWFESKAEWAEQRKSPLLWSVWVAGPQAEFTRVKSSWDVGVKNASMSWI